MHEAKEANPGHGVGRGGETGGEKDWRLNQIDGLSTRGMACEKWVMSPVLMDVKEVQRDDG